MSAASANNENPSAGAAAAAPNSLSLHAPAKINLVLGITGLRPDGFHELVSLVAPVAFGDTLHVTLHGPAAGRAAGLEQLDQETGLGDGSEMNDEPQPSADAGIAAAHEAHAAAAADAAQGSTPPDSPFVGTGSPAAAQTDCVDILHCSAPDVPTDASNLVLKAAAAFRAKLAKEGIALDGYFEFTLEKRIPAGAGLGGGSSDAATALGAMHTLCGSPLGEAQLYALAAEVGSDCALFLAKSPVIMRSRGDRLTFLGLGAHEALKGQRVLLFKPTFGINTGWAYGQMKAAEGKMYIGAKVIEGALATWEADPKKQPIPLYNNMQTPAFEKYVTLPTLLDELRAKFPGLRCLMSGSGSSCFALLAKDTPPETVAAMRSVIHNAWGADAFCEETELL